MKNNTNTQSTKTQTTVGANQIKLGINSSPLDNTHSSPGHAPWVTTTQSHSER
jgi:hypothetical protein